jgi:hypothetical protein
MILLNIATVTPDGGHGREFASAMPSRARFAPLGS